MPKMTKVTIMSHFDLEKGYAEVPKTNRKASKINEKVPGDVNRPVKKKKLQKGLLNTKSEIHTDRVVLELPIETKSEANNFEPWRVKHARHKVQQRAVSFALNPLRAQIKLPCKIILTRFAMKELDVFDNLPMSFKYIVDAICAIITGEYRAGKADGDKRITIACDQVKSKDHGIRIEVIWG